MYRRSGITKPAGFDVFHSNKSCVVFFLYTSIFFYFVYLVCFFYHWFCCQNFKESAPPSPPLLCACNLPCIVFFNATVTDLLLTFLFIINGVFMYFSIWIIMKLQTCHKNNKNCLYLNVSVIIDNFCLF